MITLAVLAVPVMYWGIWRYRHKRNLFWWICVLLSLPVTAGLLLFAGLESGILP